MRSQALPSRWRAAFIGIIALGASCPTLAQKAALVQDRDDVARNFYYEVASCNVVTFGYCQITFAPVPAGKRLIITRVSMLNQMPAAGTISSIDLRIAGGFIQAFFNATLNPSTSTGFNYTFNDSVLAKYDVGQSPQLITFSASASFLIVGTISGYTVDIP